MEKILFEQLLNENESSYLDFKQGQYKFDQATDDEKSELLKDILAFTNAWRRTDAYILIGVKEEFEDTSTVIGINEHLLDHTLQQFVNSKTQEPLTFSYIPYKYQDKQIGVIHIPKQKRPIYLTKDYGKLTKQIVYIRRGSSTDIASPDEIAKMGSFYQNEINQLSIDLQFANIVQNEFLGKSINLSSYVVIIPNRENIPDFEPTRDKTNPWSISLHTSQPIKGYYRNLYRYYANKRLIKPIGFAVKNLGEISARNVRLVISQNNNPKITILDESMLPEKPRAYVDFTAPLTNQQRLIPQISNTELTIYEKKWKLEIKFGDLQPKADSWSDDFIFIGSDESMPYKLKGHVFADNLPNPISISLEIIFSAEIIETDIKSIENIIQEERRRLYEEFKEQYDDL